MLKKIPLVILIFYCLSNCQPPRETGHPNIIYILADDLGYGDLSCLNPDSKIATPNLDLLADQGMTFTDAHSPSSVCSPTRYGILTGRYAWRTELKKSVLWAWDGPLIEPNRKTVGALLQENGYSTACIGKWHLGWAWPTEDGASINENLPIGQHDVDLRYEFGKKVDFSVPIPGGPTTRGFDYYFGDDVPNFPPYAFIENDRLVDQPLMEKPRTMFGSPGPMVEGWQLDQVLPELTKKAVEYIKAEPGTGIFQKKIGQPFFLYFPLTAPHTPIAPALEFQGKSQAGAYGDYVQEVDWVVGQVFKALKESGQEQNTLVIFTSDNGSPARDGTKMSGPVNSVLQYNHHPSYIFRGMKADIWEGGHRVPFLARWPNHIPAGVTTDNLICLTDLMATLAGLLNVSLPQNAGEDSHNMLPVMLGKKNTDRLPVVHHSIQGMFAIRQGPWKFIEGIGSGGWSSEIADSTTPGQLYHLENDPGEQNNVYQSHPGIVLEMQILLDTFRHENQSVKIESEGSH